MLRATRVAIALSLGCTASCGQPLPTGTSPGRAPCPAPSLDVSSWRSIERKEFAFRLPPDFKSVAVQGIDSWVEQFATSDSSQVVSFDYGWHSDDLSLDPGRFSEYVSCTETIGQRQALLVVVRYRNEHNRSQDGTYGAAATWRDVRNGNHLTLWTWTRDPAKLPSLLGVLRTVRFRQN